MGSFASSSIATATSWIIQYPRQKLRKYSTVQYITTPLRYVKLRSCRHERFRWTTIQIVLVGVHKFDIDNNMTQLAALYVVVYNWMLHLEDDVIPYEYGSTGIRI